MAEKDQNTRAESQTEVEGGVETPVAPPEEPTLTEQLVEQFSSAIDKDGKKAFGRWGFALFHSLSDEKAYAELVRLGFEPRDALDFYNLGCHHAAQKNYSKAIDAFHQSLKLDPDMAEAKYNLALAQENSGDNGNARKTWNQYLENCEDTEEASEIKSHLTELSNR